MDQTISSAPVMNGEPVSVVNPDGSSPVLLMCDHASAATPAEYGSLGLGSEVFSQHVAYDIGARTMTLELAERLDASAVLANFSRLLIDPNRSPSQPGFVPAVSDGIEIPANQDLDAAEIGHRQRTYYEPFHDALSLQSQKIRARGQVPLAVGIHSFTPIMQGAGRPWEIGMLWNRDPRLAKQLINWLRRDPALTVGDNEPYSGKVLGHTMDFHGGRHGYANVVIEVRQDLVATEADARAWGALLADALSEITADLSLFGVQHY
jgi:predicted N-formylglutamate amidohydrolase